VVLGAVVGAFARTGAGLLGTRVLCLVVALRVVCVDVDVVALVSGAAAAGLSAVGVGWSLTTGAGSVVVG